MYNILQNVDTFDNLCDYLSLFPRSTSDCTQVTGYNFLDSHGEVYLLFDPFIDELSYEVFLEDMSYEEGDDVEII